MAKQQVKVEAKPATIEHEGIADQWIVKLCDRSVFRTKHRSTAEALAHDLNTVLKHSWEEWRKKNGL